MDLLEPMVEFCKAGMLGRKLGLSKVISNELEGGKIWPCLRKDSEVTIVSSTDQHLTSSLQWAGSEILISLVYAKFCKVKSTSVFFIQYSSCSEILGSPGRF